MIGRYRFNWRKYETELSMVAFAILFGVWLGFWFIILPTAYSPQ